MEQTVKKKFGIRDIMTIAAMMVINDHCQGARTRVSGIP